MHNDTNERIKKILKQNDKKVWKGFELGFLDR